MDETVKETENIKLVITKEGIKMKINFKSEYLPDKYSKYADKEFCYKDQPVVSFPFEIQDIPVNSKYFCFTLVDFDSIPVCGFSWIHWTVANVPATLTEIPEDFSRNLDIEKVQGTNSFSSCFVGETDKKITQRYVGPTPPDKDHEYTLTVYVLDSKIDVTEGFFLNELYKKISGKILKQATIQIKARA